MNVMLGFEPYDKQVEVAESIRDNMLTAVKGAVGVGKTAIIASDIMWWLNSFAPAKAYSLAPTMRQVEQNIWGDVHSLYHDARFPIGGQLNLTQLKLKHDIWATGVATKEPNYIQGIHGPNVLLIIDEFPGLDPRLFSAIENVTAGGNVRVVVLMNPTPTSGPAYDVFHKHKGKMINGKMDGWNCITMSAWDSPNVKARKVVKPGLVTYEAIMRWIKIFGRNSNFVRIKVDAKFPTQEPDSLIPLDWIHKSYSREQRLEGKKGVGVDVARYGDDKSEILPFEGLHLHIDRMVELDGHNTQEVAGRVKIEIEKIEGEIAAIDAIGVGAGVVDACRVNLTHAVACGINVGEKPRNKVTAPEKHKFFNFRAELGWAVRWALDPSNPDAITMTEDSDLEEELCAFKWKAADGGAVIKITSTEDIKKKLGRSPDKAMAVFFAIAAMIFGDSGELMEAKQASSGLEVDLLGAGGNATDQLESEGGLEGSGDVSSFLGGMDPDGF